MNTTTDDGLELFPEAGSAANIGIMLFRSSAIDLARVCIQYIPWGFLHLPWMGQAGRLLTPAGTSTKINLGEGWLSWRSAQRG